MRWVRAVISLEMANAIIWGFLTGKIETLIFLEIAGACIAWWYWDRTKEKKAGVK